MADGFWFVLFDSNSECGGKQKQKIRDELFNYHRGHGRYHGICIGVKLGPSLAVACTLATCAIRLVCYTKWVNFPFLLAHAGVISLDVSWVRQAAWGRDKPFLGHVDLGSGWGLLSPFFFKQPFFVELFFWGKGLDYIYISPKILKRKTLPRYYKGWIEVRIILI